MTSSSYNHRKCDLDSAQAADRLKKCGATRRITRGGECHWGGGCLGNFRYFSIIWGQMVVMMGFVVLGRSQKVLLRLNMLRSDLS